MTKIEIVYTNVFTLVNVVDAFDDLKNNDGSMAKVLVKF